MLITEPLSKAEITLVQIAERLYQQEVAKLDEGKKAVVQSVYDSHGILPGTNVQFAQTGPNEFVLAYERSEPSTGKDESIDDIAPLADEASDIVAPRRIPKRRKK